MERSAKRRRIGEEEEEEEELNTLNSHYPQFHCSDLPEKMKASESGASIGKDKKTTATAKPQFVPAKDDSKPVLQDPILRSDPIETEEAVLRLPPFSMFQEHQQKASLTPKWG